MSGFQRSSAMAALVVACLALALAGGEGAGAEPSPDVPAVTSGNGISVLGVSRVDDRTVDVRVSTPLVSDGATIKGNTVRVMLPEGYDASSPRRYPVLYLLHGGASSYTTWYDTSAASLASLSGDDLIIVMPDGGKIGMYTDWVDQSLYRQSWRTFHLDQLIPFVDRNLKTIDERGSRAIAGVSMGGLGAFRYTFERPDLFTGVTSFSGVLNPHAPFAVAGLAVVNAYWKMPTFGQYGLPFWPFWGSWIAGNPVAHAASYADVDTLMYVGEGTDPVEYEVRTEAEAMSGALARAGVGHTFINYGNPGGSCNGGHSTGCATMALEQATPRIRGSLSLPSGPVAPGS